MRTSTKTRQKILDVGLRLFMQLGFDNTYMDEVARKAGVTKPAIYYYFKDKQTLFEATAVQFLDQLAQMMSPDNEETLRLEELLSTIFASLPKWLGRYGRMSGITDRTSLLRGQVFVYDAMTRIPDFRSRFRTLYRSSAGLLGRACEEAARRGEIRAGIDTSTVGVLINSMIEGLLLMAMVDPEMDLEKIGPKGTDTLWRMLRA